MSRRRRRAHSSTGRVAPPAGPAPTRAAAPRSTPRDVERAVADRRAARGDDVYTTIVPILGMTCRSCENRIERHVSRISNVVRVTVSAPRGRAEVESVGPIRLAALDRAVQAAGYEIGETPWVARDESVWMTAVAGVALVVVLALVAQVLGIGDLTSGVGDLSQGGILVALLLGLAAGFSTCMALVGGLVLALSAGFQRARAAAEVELGTIAQMRPGVVFVLGRVGGYATFGAGLGAVGASITMPPQLTAVLMVAVGLVMALLGTRLTGLSPRLAGWSPTLPMGLGRRLGLAGDGSAPYSDRRAATLGAASFFLPCGFTQAVQIYALSTGSPLLGGALLGAFAIGTAPGLLAMAGLPVVVPAAARPTLLRLVGVVVLAFAFVNVSSGIRLSGIDLPSLVIGDVAAAVPNVTFANDGTQLLTTYQEGGGYSPSNVAIYAGVPTRWTIESRTTSSCAASVIIPRFDFGVRLRLGPNTFDLPALPAGRIDYSCAMGMYGGRITIVEPPAGFDPKNPNASLTPSSPTP